MSKKAFLLAAKSFVFVILMAVVWYMLKPQAVVSAHGISPVVAETFKATAKATLGGKNLLADWSFTPDWYRWYSSESGKVSLELKNGNYHAQAARGNQQVNVDLSVDAKETEINFDFDAAPIVAEVFRYEIKKGEQMSYSLGIKNASEVVMENNPNGVTLKRSGEDFVLDINTKQSGVGFYLFYLESKNENATARSIVTLVVQPDKAVKLIKSVDDFRNIKKDLGGNYVLASDLDFTETHEWISIGTQDFPFTGVFDGGGHSLTGINFDQEGEVSLFGWTSNSVIKNLVIREPQIKSSDDVSAGVVATASSASLFENIGVFGGIITYHGNIGAVGVMTGGGSDNATINCFSSVDFDCERSYANNGSMTGLSNGLYLNCGNTGKISGKYLIGGITGLLNGGIMTQCYSSGEVRGQAFLGQFHPGGLLNTMGKAIVSRSCYERGSAIHAGGVFDNNDGIFTNVSIFDKLDYRDRTKLALIGYTNDDKSGWGFASQDSWYPVPTKIFKQKAPTPILVSGDSNIVSLLPIDGVLYSYTVDGTDPYQKSEGVASAKIALKKSETLQVFASKSGFMDSDIVQHTYR